jgi:hypothetical protein
MKLSGIKKGIKATLAVMEQQKPTSSQLFSTTAVLEPFTIQQSLTLDSENFALELLRYKQRVNDLKKEIKTHKDTSVTLYNKVYPVWDMMYHTQPQTAKIIARELGVSPENREFSSNIERLESIVDALLQVLYFGQGDLKGINILYQQERSKRSYFEKEAFTWKQKYETLLSESKAWSSKPITVTSAKIVFKNSPSLPVKLEEPEVANISTNEETTPTVIEEAEIAQKEIKEIPSAFFKTIEQPAFVTELKQKGYAVEDPNDPSHDIMIEYENTKTPLCYINYGLDENAINQIMQNTDSIMFLFDSKELYKVGNSKFTNWLLKTGRRKEVKYSFTTFDELKETGLNKLKNIK